MRRIGDIQDCDAGTLTLFDIEKRAAVSGIVKQHGLPGVPRCLRKTRWLHDEGARGGPCISEVSRSRCARQQRRGDSAQKPRAILRLGLTSWHEPPESCGEWGERFKRSAFSRDTGNSDSPCPAARLANPRRLFRGPGRTPPTSPSSRLVYREPASVKPAYPPPSGVAGSADPAGSWATRRRSYCCPSAQALTPHMPDTTSPRPNAPPMPKPNMRNPA